MRSTTLDLAFFTLLAAGVVYFSVDAWLGSSGGIHLGPLNDEIGALERDVAELTETRDALAAKNAGLKGRVIDQDLLDERLRSVFGVVPSRRRDLDCA